MSDVSDSADSFGLEDAIIIPPGQGSDFGETSRPLPPEDPEPERPRKDKAKAGPPRLEEWEDFFGRVLLKGITTRYVDYLFREVDEELLTPNEMKRLYLSVDERSQVARPLAELSNKVDFMRKHGRVIIASSDAVESLFVLSLWFSRVNRIAAKYRPIDAQIVSEQGGVNGYQRPPPQNGEGGGTQYPADWREWDLPSTG